MYCEACNAELPLQSIYCSKCGALVAGGAAPTEQRRRYSLWRVGILTLVSLGLYFPYWMYVSWKHLATEMPGKDFHPTSHALSQLIPIYGLVVLYQHFSFIKVMQEKAGIRSSLNPGLMVVFSIVSLGIVTVDLLLDPFNSAVLTYSYPLIPTAIVLWGQANLNEYWGRTGPSHLWPAGTRPSHLWSAGTRPSHLWSAGTGPGEIIVSALGGVIALVIVIGSVISPTSWIASVSEAESVEPIVVGSSREGTIRGFVEVDAYHFIAEKGLEYAIVIEPIPVLNSNDDLLESALVTLWDSDAQTTLLSQSGSTPIAITWTASTGGTKYVTIENDDFISKGDYILRVSLVGQ